MSKFIFLIIISVFFFYSIFLTRLSPDLYVFVKYAIEDNIEKTISWYSIFNNNFLFDLISLIGYKFNLSSGIEYLLLVSIFVYFLFLLKYFYLLKIGSLSNVLIVFFSSFITFDINAFRFHLAIIFLIFALKQKKSKYLFLISSFFSHIFPLIFFYLKKLYFIPLILLIYIMPFLINSRYALYFEDVQFVLFKSLILIFPSLTCLKEALNRKEINSDRLNLNYIYINLSSTFLIIGIFFLSINTVFSSRMFETVFYLSTVLNLFYNFSSKNKFLLVIFSLLLFSSRVYNGVNTSANTIFQIIQ